MSDKPSFPIVWPSLIIAILGIYSYITYKPPLDTARPTPKSKPGFPSPPSPPGLKAYHARLWEDPLAIAYETSYADEPATLETMRTYLRHAVQRVYTPEIQKHLPRETQGSRTAPRELIVLPVLVPGGKYGEDRERRMRMRYAVVSALSLCNYRPKSPARLNALTLPIITDGAGVDAPLAQDVIVPVEMYQEFPDRGVFIDNQSDTKIPPDAIIPPDCDCQSGRRPQGRETVYAPKPPILVCWVDESYLGARPLAVLAQLLDHLLRDTPRTPPLATPTQSSAVPPLLLSSFHFAAAANSRAAQIAAAIAQFFSSGAELREAEDYKLHADVCILGPSSSDMLLAMAYESDNPNCFASTGRDDAFIACQNNLPLKCGYFSKRPYLARPVRLYSPRATVPFRYSRNSDPHNTEAALYNFSGPGPTPSGIEVSRIIGSDARLAIAIKQELQLRHAWPTDDADVADYHVVLVAERDTCYGQAIMHTFDQVFKPRSDDAHKDRAEPDYVNYLTPESYLRGIDGELYHDDRSPSENDGDNNSYKDAATGRVVRDDIEPEGVSQKDYLIRLQQRLINLDQQLRDRGGNGITAIGVVGSDVFDKLLILRSLRKSFPNAVFFTTDLDANYWRQTEYATTGNLIVASHFGVELHPDLQRDVPTFRDAYQTSLFLAALLAGEDSRTAALVRRNTDKIPSRYDLWSESWSTMPLEPLVFEIGRHGPYQLTVTGGDPRLSPRLNDAWNSYVADGNSDFRPALSAQLHPVSPRERPTRGQTNAVIWSRLAALVCLIVVLSIGVVSIRNVIRSVRSGLYYYADGFAYGFRNTIVAACTYCNVTPPWDRAVEFPQPPPDLKKGRRILFFILLGFVAMIVFVLIIHADHRRPNGEPFAFADGLSIWPSVLLNLIATVVGMIAVVRSYSALKQNADDIRDDLKCRMTDVPWSDMSTFQPPTHIVLRALGYAAILLLAMVLLYRSFPTLHIPARGDTARILSKLSVLLAYLTVIYLSVFVVINVRLILDTIRRLGKEKLDSHTCDKAQAIIQLTARRTEEIGQTLLPPFIMLLIMYVAILPIFDDWSPSLPLWILWGLLIGSLVWSAWRMRRASGKLREKIELQLLDIKIAAPKSSHDGNAAMIQAIGRENRGAFRPWTEDYLLQALAIPVGGGSGLLLLQQWLMN